MSLSWIYLIIAALFEISWAIGLKYSANFTNLRASSFTIIAMILSVVFLAKAMNGIPLGTAYAIWVGIGAAGTIIMGIVLFQDPITIPRVFFLCLLIGAIIGLKMT
ncbi:MAG: multidrug efflux SMR transporter [Pseudomonadota bacterium]|jgi:quaternary ammonium compound-resistance protein SugE|nr:multidrug efflux SMR transporter [Pseudomonadota bacterium]MEC7701277.1 multidrug efflux SMR transporter [Pseudomonadota bacterium]MEC9235052.1 multidrug efflux SMR transporter [Pseudomonadota bacterium]|tara:strand:- start:1148 stop:1465 length:318 start_codon:yes stop_codon:yes gene_type:complete